MSRAPAAMEATRPTPTAGAGPADSHRGLAFRILADYRLLLAGLTALGLGLRLYQLGRRSLWQDELNSLAATALRLPDFLAALQVEANMTLYYWALFGWLRIVGVGASESWIRLPSALAGAAAVPLAFLLGRRLHSTSAGIAAAGLVAVNAYHVLMSQEARSYALVASLTLLSYLLLDRATQSGRRRDWLLHGLVTALAFYGHSYTAFVVLGQAAFVLSRRSGSALRGFVQSGALMAVLLLPAVPFFVRNAGGGKLAWLPPVTSQDVWELLLDYSGGSPWTLALYAVLGLFGLLAARPGARSRGYRNWLLLTWFVVPIGLALGISLLYKPVFLARYPLGTLPALALLAGIGLARLPRPLGMAAFGAVAVLSIGLLQGGRFHARPVEEWREAARYALRQAEPGDGWVFVQKRSQAGFEYYAGWRWGRNPDAPYVDVFEPFDWREAYRATSYRGVQSMPDLERFAASHPRIWLIQSHEIEPETRTDTAAPVRQFLVRSGYGASERGFSGPIRVVLYQKK